MRVSCTHAMCEKECVKTNYAWVVLIKKRRFRPQIRTPNARNKIGALAWDEFTIATATATAIAIAIVIITITIAIGPGCTRTHFVHFCHSSEKNVSNLAVSSATHVSGQTANKSSRKRQSCNWLVLHVPEFFFFIKTSTPIGENEKIIPTDQTSKKPFSLP